MYNYLLYVVLWIFVVWPGVAVSWIVFLKVVHPGGAWVAQSVERLTSAQVMISRFVSSSPTSGSVLTARSLEPALDSASLSYSRHTLHAHVGDPQPSWWLCLLASCLGSRCFSQDALSSVYARAPGRSHLPFWWHNLARSLALGAW